MSRPARFVVGIDLGTTHCALARAPLDDDDGTPPAEVVAIAQLVGSGQIEARRLLPSFVYLPPEAEGSMPLPWDADREVAVGAYARRRAAETPGRVVASAKSWLCHPSLDRRAGVLPVAAPPDVDKLSPVEASFRFLEHLIEAYDHEYAATEGALTEQKVVITVPASFDAAARELTVEAALAAGIEDLTLLEEPQAALYAWLEAAGEGWRAQLAPGDVVLVVDIGGGTSDFSAIAVREEDGDLALERVAVGDHILLGGDNIDLALAHHVRQRLETEGHELDAWQMGALTHAARDAKETLLSAGERDRVPIVVPRRGAKLVGTNIRTEVTREAVEALVLEGFFPVVDADARPAPRRRAGLTQVGLPFAQDPAVTRHLAAFLGRHGDEKASTSSGVQPTAVLYNGGVMRSETLRA
ncbi:MAG: Hsp70 family protein, partial [Myxococcota bacterium]